MKPQTCPDLKTLESLLLGRLPADERGDLGEHLLHCDQCADSAETIAACDELTEALHSQQFALDDEVLLAKVIQRGKELRSEADTLQPDETLSLEMPDPDTADSPSRDADAEILEAIDFLHPPERPDELGRLGGYRVLDVMGVGGMGVVFRAEDPKLERLVALKAMKPAIAASKSAKNRFLREAKATASIDHDNIVSIYHVGEDGHIPFIAMQFLRGESLQSKLQRQEKLDQLDVVRIGREVAAGLTAAHKRDLIHRDIKPDNIWIEEEAGRAKILDFGLVRSVRDDAGLTQSGMILGTPRYMAPEQAQGKEVDHRGDLFSLGSVLYHLVSGKAPFDGDNMAATLVAVTDKEPAPIAGERPQLDANLASLIMRLLSKDCEQRPQSAAEVAHSLSEIEKNLQENRAGLAEQTGPSQTGPSQTGQETPAAVAPIGGEVDAKPQPKSRKSLFIGGAFVTIAAGVLIVLWATGMILKVTTKDGTLIVKVTSDDFAASVKGKRVIIQDTRTDRKYFIDLTATEQTKKLPPSDYRFLLTTASGLRTRTERFTIKDGEDEQVEVWWQPTVNTASSDTRPGDTARAPTGFKGMEYRTVLETTSRLTNSRDFVFRKDGASLLIRDALMLVKPIGAGDERTLAKMPANLLAYDLANDRGAGCYHGENDILLWSVDNQKVTQRLVGHQTGRIWAAISQNGSRLVSFDANGVVKVWDTEKGTETHSFAMPKIARMQNTLPAISADGSLIAVKQQGSTADESFLLMDLRKGERVELKIGDHRRRFDYVSMAFSPDGGQLACTNHAGVLAVWDIASRSLVASPSVPGPCVVNSLRFSPNGRLVAFAGAYGVVCSIFETSTWKLVSKLERPEHGGAPHLEFSPDGSLLAIAEVNVRDGKPRRQIELWRVNYEALTGQEHHSEAPRNHASSADSKED